MNVVDQINQRPWLGRALAFLLLFAVVGAAIHLALAQLARMEQRYDGVVQSRLSLLAGYRRVAEGRAALEAALADSKKLDTARYYLKNSSPSLAAAEMQDKAQSLCEREGVKIDSVNIAPHKDKDGRRKITINFTIKGTIEQTQHVLYELEAMLPYTFVSNLSIKSTVNPRRWRPEPGVEPEVRSQFDLVGYAMLPVKK